MYSFSPMTFLIRHATCLNNVHKLPYTSHSKLEKIPPNWFKAKTLSVYYLSLFYLSPIFYEPIQHMLFSTSKCWGKVPRTNIFPLESSSRHHYLVMSIGNAAFYHYQFLFLVHFTFERYQYLFLVHFTIERFRTLHFVKVHRFHDFCTRLSI